MSSNPNHPMNRLNRTEVLPEDMANKNYSIIVQGYMFGQIRIQLTDVRWPDHFAPPGHGSIVRELDTYNVDTASRAIMELSEAEDPKAYCIGLERDWNCEYSGDGPFMGDRIRLDETQETNPYRRCAKQVNPALRRELFLDGACFTRSVKKEFGVGEQEES